jgi:hypothetical protein
MTPLPPVTPPLVAHRSAARAIALRYLLPTLFVACVPLLWTDSGASRDWEFFDVPVGFADRLRPVTGLLIGVLLIQIAILDRRAGGAPERDVLFSPRYNAWFFLGVLSIFVARAFEYADLFPVRHFGETNSAILGARRAEAYGVLSAYNAGFGPLFAPVFRWLGETFPIVRVLTILTWGMTVTALLVLYSMLHRGANNLLVFVPPLLTAMILPSLRTYTWHAGAPVAAVAAFFLVAAIGGAVTTRRRVVFSCVGASLYAVGFTAYHAAVVFIPLVLFIGVLGFVLERRPDRFGWIVLAVVVILGLASALAIQSEDVNGLRDRVYTELADPRENWSKSDNLMRSWDNFFYSFLSHDASFPVRVLFLVGLIGAARAFRSSVFARTALVLFVGIYGSQAFLWGHADWSQNCYTIIPIVALLLIALHHLAHTLALIRPRWVYGTTLLVAVSGISSLEYRHYFEAALFRDRQYEQHPHDTATQLSLALRDAHTMSVRDETWAFVMPDLYAAPQPVAFDPDGLEWKHPRSQRILGRIAFFTSPEHLRELVQRLRQDGRPIRVYFGHGNDHALNDLAPYLDALPTDAALVQREPYADVMQPYVQLRLTYVDVPRGPLRWADAPAEESRDAVASR